MNKKENKFFAGLIVTDKKTGAASGCVWTDPGCGKKPVLQCYAARYIDGSIRGRSIDALAKTSAAFVFATEKEANDFAIAESNKSRRCNNWRRKGGFTIAAGVLRLPQ